MPLRPFRSGPAARLLLAGAVPMLTAAAAPAARIDTGEMLDPPQARAR